VAKDYYNENDPYAAAWLRNLIAAGHIAPGDVDERSIADVSGSSPSAYRQCHFFAGIGGWSYALRLAGWPDDRPVWTGSCPCQPFSNAGKRAGTDDPCHLWPEWFRLIRQCRPATIFGEQVASRAGLAWFDAVSADLEGAGYAVGAADLCAAGVGAPHIRQRLYFVANAPDRERGDRESEACGQQEGEARRHGVPCILGHPAVVGREGLGPEGAARPGDEGTTAERAGEVGELADADSSGRSLERKRRLPGDGHAPRRDDVDGRGEGGVADAECDGCRGGGLGSPARASSGMQGADGERQRVRPDAGPGGRASFWSPCDWIPCRDGKARPVEPGTFPLAHGLSAGMGCVRPGEDSPFRVIRDPKTGRSIGQAPWRVGMLRGYGNAIVPRVAAEFVMAFLGTEDAA